MTISTTTTHTPKGNSILIEDPNTQQQIRISALDLKVIMGTGKGQGTKLDYSWTKEHDGRITITTVEGAHLEFTRDEALEAFKQGGGRL